jgi:hypothetical protein
MSASPLKSLVPALTVRGDSEPLRLQASRKERVGNQLQSSPI